MSTNFVTALNREELMVEFMIRERDLTTLPHHLTSLRKELNKIIRDEAFHSFTGLRTYKPNNVANDLTITKKALGEMQISLSELETNFLSKPLELLTHRLAHYSNRVELIQGAPTGEREQLLVIISKLKEGVEKLISQNEDEDSFCDPLEDPEYGSPGSPVRRSSVLPAATPDIATLLQTLVTGKDSSAAVQKWNLNYDGTGGAQPLFNFVERAKELAQARGVQEKIMFNKAVEFFSGEALVWYRTLGSRVTNWEQLVTELKVRFLSADFSREYLDQIKNRKQKPSESVRSYIESMFAEFSRVSPVPSEEEQLWVIRRNLLPHISLAMGPIPPASGEQFIQLAQASERLVNWTTGGASTSTLAVDTVTAKPSATNIQQRIAMGSCWNCQEKGHYYNSCSKPISTFCTVCGRKGRTTDNCRGFHAKNAAGRGGVAARSSRN